MSFVTRSGSLALSGRMSLVGAMVGLAISGCALRVSHDRVVASTQGLQASNGPASNVAPLPPASAPAPTGGSTTGGSGVPIPGRSSSGSSGTGAATAGSAGASSSTGAAGAGAGSTGATSGQAAACKGTGTIVLGNVAPYGASGVGQNYAPGREVLKVWEKDVNARGGICGRKVQVITEDDGGNASNTSADLRDLVENKHVAAIIAWGTALTLSGGL
ncbi:MAG: branched-chain amino acid transport system substrate-binding protein, partial [Acidimicrobiaceae bacterium]